MIKLEELKRDELKTKAKELGLKDYHALSKPDLITLIRKFEESTNFKNESIVKLALTKVISKKAEQWKSYFAKINVSPKEFLKRNPNHPFKEFIEELIEK